MKGYPTLYKNIIFIEALVDEAQKVAPIKADLSFKLGAQLKCLTDVKEVLYQRAIELGCNCVMDFKYMQKSRLIAIDDVAHFGYGIAARLPEDKYNEILDYIQKRN